MAIEQKQIILASSPHFSSPVTTQKLMMRVLIALTPITFFGIYLYGIPAIGTIVVSIITALLSEVVFRIITKQKPRIYDLSAVVTGLLLALILPPSTPLWMTALGSFFAIVVAKEFFGGIGANVFNPALIGRVFLLMSFPMALTTWTQPPGLAQHLTNSITTATPSQTVIADAVTTATPLNIVKLGGTVTDVANSLAQSGLASSPDYAALIQALFIGRRAGCIGESSILLILLGGIYLLLMDTIDWRAPLSMLITAFVASWLFGMDPIFGLLTGGLMFGAVFMATDYVTAPITSKGKIIFGIGAGLISVLIRKWGGYPEGTSYAILIMNACTPFLNKLLPKKYGYVPPKKIRKEATR
jgi:electron transport complex protein RnfD